MNPRRFGAGLLLGLALALAQGVSGAAAQQIPADTARSRPQTPAPGDTLPRDTTLPTPVADAAADSIIARLRALDGYVATTYIADSATYSAQGGVLRLQGNAEVERAGDRLNADSIVYLDREQLVEAYGTPRVTGQAQELTGDVLFYDLAARRASARGARTTISQTATWFVTGEMVSAVGADRVYASHAQFTTCDLESPHYHFESDRIKVIRDKILVAVPARLYFGKVPVMVLPFVVQNLEEGRRSGLLVPRFTLTDIVRNSPGYTRQISDLGWYWAVNDYLGAQVAGTWRSGAYVSLMGNLAFNWRRQFLAGNFGFSRYWQSSGNRQFGVQSTASWQPSERTNLGLSANYMSSTQFIRRTTIDPREATQDLVSTFNLGRRFDWGMLQLGSDLRKSIADGGITATLPSFSISPNSITLFREATPEAASWYNNATVAWSLSGSRALTRDKSDFDRQIQDETRTQLRGGLTQFSMGNLNLSATGSLNQRVLDELIGRDPLSGIPRGTLPGQNIDVADWNATLGYQIRLIGNTMVTPGFSFNQELRRDSLTGGEYLGGPRRMSFGASTNTAIFGFYPGFGPYSALRHRLSPTISYSYAPEVNLTPRQLQVFGASGGYAQNRVTLGFNQTFEAKLRNPTRETEGADTAGLGSDTASAPPASRPADPQKVTLLSISTSSVEYDFVRAAREGSGFVTNRISNSLTSDYLRGMSVQMDHELFDQRAINPNDAAQRGKLGTFSPRLSSLSTGFDLGPSSAILRWIGLANDRNPVTQGEVQGASPTDAPTAPGSQSMTNNPLSSGAGPWRVGLSYSYSRAARTFMPANLDFDDDPIQSVNADMAFALTAGWAVNWNTSYSITDGEFGSHRLNFRRDLHRWEANFSFYKTPSGNSAFEFFVQLIDNPDIKFDHRESDLGIDRQ